MDDEPQILKYRGSISKLTRKLDIARLDNGDISLRISLASEFYGNKKLIRNLKQLWKNEAALQCPEGFSGEPSLDAWIHIADGFNPRTGKRASATYSTIKGVYGTVTCSSGS